MAKQRSWLPSLRGAKNGLPNMLHDYATGGGFGPELPVVVHNRELDRLGLAVTVETNAIAQRIGAELGQKRGLPGNHHMSGHRDVRHRSHQRSQPETRPVHQLRGLRHAFLGIARKVLKTDRATHNRRVLFGD